MRENKVGFPIFGAISLISLAFAITLEWDLLDYIVFNFTEYRDFAINVFIGLFGSATLAFLISLINYKVQKKKELNEFYMKTITHMKQIDVFSYEILQCPEKGSLSEYISKFNFERFQLEINLAELKLISSQIKLFTVFKNKRINTCICDIVTLFEKVEIQLKELDKLSKDIIEEPKNKWTWLGSVLPYNNLSKDLKTKVNDLEKLTGIISG